MHEDEIFELTRAGDGELRSSATSLTPQQIEVLVRFDGTLTLGQVRASLPPPSAAGFDAIFRALHDRGLLARARTDPLTLQFQADLQNLGRSVDAAEADAGLALLRRAGFYVQIARSRQGAGVRPQGRPLTALLVEDEQALAHFTRSYLMLSGFQVRTAGTRAEVVAELRKPPRPDLVLLDVVLPDADGFDILLRMRQHPVLREVPVIMLTGKATREAVIQGLSAGADGYITKPFEPEALMRAVSTVLGLPEESSASRGGKDPWGNSDALQKR